MLMLQTMSGEVAEVTGLLFTDWRTAIVVVVLPAMPVVQLSADTSHQFFVQDFMTGRLTMGRRMLGEEGSENGTR